MGPATLVYDDDCGFCTWWAEFFDNRTDLVIVGFSDVDPDLEARLPDDFRSCSHVVTDDAVYSCGASIEAALLHTSLGSKVRPLIAFLQRFSLYRSFREWAYRQGAHHRDVWGRVLSKTPPARSSSCATNEDQTE